MFPEFCIPILSTSMFSAGSALPSTNLALDFAARAGFDVDLGEELDLVFLRFCFGFGILGRSVDGISLHKSVVYWPMDSPKSVTNCQEGTKLNILACNVQSKIHSILQIFKITRDIQELNCKQELQTPVL